MAKVIISIHGLRNKPPKEQLIKWVKMAIEEGIQKKGYNLKIPQLELVYWADILYDKPKSLDEKDKKSPYFLEEVYVSERKRLKILPNKYRLKVVNYLRKLMLKIFLKENYKLRYPIIYKKILHSYFHELEVYYTENCQDYKSINCKAKEQIIGRLEEILRKHHDDEVFLIAHSMGSIVAFDVLSFIYKETSIKTFVTIGSPLGLPFVISKIAQQSKKNISEHIKLQTPEAVCKHWYNFSDINDYIAFDYKLSDTFSANKKGVKVVDQFVNNTYKMKGRANHHKSFGYLRTPELIDAIKEFLEE